MFLKIFSVLLALVTVCRAEPAPPNSIIMNIINNAGRPIELYWVHVETRELQKQTEKPIRNSTEKVINSYDGHEFSIHFQKPPPGENNKGVQFTKGPKEEKVIISYDEHEQRMKVVQTTTTHEMIDDMAAAIDECRGDPSNNELDCITDTIVAEMSRLESSTETMLQYRDAMTSKIQRYVCQDDALQITEPDRSSSVTLDPRSPDVWKYTVDTIVDRPQAKIWTYKKFADPQELALVESKFTSADAEPPVALDVGIDGSATGGSEHETTMESVNGMVHIWIPIHSLYHRLVKLVSRFVPSHKLDPFKRQMLSLVQYNSTQAVSAQAVDWEAFESDALVDLFNPLADDLDKGGKRKYVTCVLSLHAAKSGGALLFPNVDVALRPEAGDVVCFYETAVAPPVGTELDSSAEPRFYGYTRMRTCPVFEGESRWATFLL